LLYQRSGLNRRPPDYESGADVEMLNICTHDPGIMSAVL